MNLIRSLFSDWVGLLSVFTISFVLVIAAFIFFYVTRHMGNKSK